MYCPYGNHALSYFLVLILFQYGGKACTITSRKYVQHMYGSESLVTLNSPWACLVACMDFLHHCASEIGLPARREWAMGYEMRSFGSLGGLFCAEEGSHALLFG
jgi:hypothetical protein